MLVVTLQPPAVGGAGILVRPHTSERIAAITNCSLLKRSAEEDVKLAAANALAGIVGDDLTADCIIPNPFDGRVAAAVADQARREGLNRT